MICRVRKPTLLEGAIREAGYIGETDASHAAKLREQSRVQTFETRAEAEFAAEVEERLDWNAIRSLAADLRDAHGDEFDATENDKWELVEYIGRHVADVELEAFTAENDPVDPEDADTEPEGEDNAE